jgi:fumarate reductase flavoprotein subunit
MTSNPRILRPFTLPNGTELKNRLLMAPMTTCTGYFDGSVTSELVEYYRARAGSIGTIIVECCFIDDYGLAFPAPSASTMTRKLPVWLKSPTPSKPKGQKRFCRSITAGVWSIRS